jgi:uncharacterized repeat protein (TIGR02543 family)
MGGWTFRECRSLESITIKNGLTSIGEETFYFCKSLKSITIPSSVKSIGKHAFTICGSLKSVTIQGDIKSIGKYAFLNCKSLKTVNMPTSVKDIGPYAFQGCKSLTSITIPYGVKIIQPLTFKGCKSLKSITIPNSVTQIGVEAFGGCKSLKSITIPNSVKKISKGGLYNDTFRDGAFVGCPEQLKFKVFKNSCAHKYAKDYNLKFSFIKPNYKATFNANKGKISGKAKFVKKVKPYAKLGKLKTPKRAGYTFKGWYTKKSGGTKIKASTWMYAQNVTYYAQWKKKA